MTPRYSLFLAFLATGALVVALAACDTGDPDPPPPPPPGENPLAGIYDTTATEIRVTDIGDGAAPGVDEVVWTSDYTYILTNKVFVNDGQVVRIEPGTVIKGEPGLRENATAFVVARGGQLFAEGRADAPIIFTALADDVDDPNDEPGEGSWGGLLILGNASTNTTPGVLAIEGIPTSEPRGLYGCGDRFACDDDDSSGTIRYVSVRYGGAEIGEGNEINGITLGGVGRGTVFEYVEVFTTIDDGFEWFGGTVDGRYLVASFAGDDPFDSDQGYRGRGQYLLAIQDHDRGNHGAEQDGGDASLGGEDARPLSRPVFWNVTYIGSGSSVTNPNLGNALLLRENTAASYHRSYFTAFAGGISVQDRDGNVADSRERLEQGDMVFRDLLFGTFEAGDDAEQVAPQDFVRSYLQANDTRFIGGTPGVVGISRDRDGLLDPTATGPALTNLGPAPTDAFFQNSSCIGAVCPGDDWLRGWTALDQLGYLAN